MKARLTAGALLLATLWSTNAAAVTSAEIYTTEAYQYGRFSARIQFAPGSGVVSSFFLWKDGSEVEGTFWNELDFEKLEAACFVETNTIYGNPVGLHSERHNLAADLCGSYHVYTYEWTPEYLSWEVDGVEIRRETGDVVQAYAQNTASGMQLRFNVWPGDETFGGVFSPSILPVYQYIDWVEYASYSNGSFTIQWRDDFDQPNLHARWSTASWESPKNNSTHSPSNVGIKDGYVVLALTTDQATGTGQASPAATDPDGDTSDSGSDTSSSSESDTTSASDTTDEQTSSTDSAGDSTDSVPTDSTSADSTSTVNTTDGASTSSASGEPSTGTSPTTAPSSTQAPATSGAPSTTGAETTTGPGAPATSNDAPVVESDSGSDSAGCACTVGAERTQTGALGLMGVAAFAALGVWRRARHR